MLVEGVDRVVAEAVGRRKAVSVALVHRAKQLEVEYVVFHRGLHNEGINAPSRTTGHVITVALCFDADPYGDGPRCASCRPCAVSANGILVEPSGEGEGGVRGVRRIRGRSRGGVAVQNSCTVGVVTPGLVGGEVPAVVVVVVGVELTVVQIEGVTEVVAGVREGIFCAVVAAITTAVFIGFLEQLDVLDDL